MKKEMQFMYICLCKKKHWKEGENTYLARFVDAEVHRALGIHENYFSEDICMKISV